MSDNYNLSNLLPVPSGWEKGEPLVVSMKQIRSRKVWSVQQEMKFDVNRKIKPDHVAMQWFDDWDQFALFIQWWNEA